MQLVTNSNGQNAYLKHILDASANTPQGCADGHVDDFNAGPVCAGLTDLPGTPFWTVDDQ